MVSAHFRSGKTKRISRLVCHPSLITSHLQQHFRFIRHDAIYAHVNQRFHGGAVVDRPQVDLNVLTMEGHR
jgi:hypothetical protein